MLQGVCFFAPTDHITIPIHGGGHPTARPELAHVNVAFDRSRGMVRPETDAIINQHLRSWVSARLLAKSGHYVDVVSYCDIL